MSNMSAVAADLKRRMKKAVEDDAIKVISGKRQIEVKFYKNKVLYKLIPGYDIPFLQVVENAFREFCSVGHIHCTGSYLTIFFNSVMEQTMFLNTIGYNVFNKNAEKEQAKKERQSKLRAGKLTWQRFMKKVQEECPVSENWYRGESSFGEGFIMLKNSDGRDKKYILSEFIDRDAFIKSWYRLSYEYKWIDN